MHSEFQLICVSQEDDYVQLAAMHHYIQHGPGHNKENVREVVQECITTTLIENKSMTNWIQLITKALTEVKNKRSPC